MSSTKSLTQLIVTLLVLVVIVPPIFTEQTKAQPTVNVTLSNLSFNPQNITVKIGSTITWTNEDAVIYTLWFVKADDGTTYLRAGREGLSDPILPGSSWSEGFNEIITLKYHSFERLWITGYITVVPEAPPVSIFTYQPSQPTVDQTVTFDASESYDSDGAIISYTWDFGDGTKQSTTESSATHSYTNEGAYKVALTVTDDSGLTGTSSKTVVIAPDATPPVAEAGPDQMVNEDTTVTFDGSGSTDNVGIASYVWTFTDVTVQALTGVNPSYKFATPGEYVVTLNATDLAGNWDTDTVTVNVLDVTDPVAKAGISQTVVEDAIAEFDATNSSDNTGITSYEWDFGDGTTGTGPTTTHTYTEPGDYTVTLTVKDAGNNIGTDSIVITVLLDTDSDGIPDITDPDKDGDEMPNTWEQENGLDPLDPADASQDKDGDGLTNLQEYQQGTDPNNYFSPFPLWIVGVAAVAVVGVAVLAYIVLMRK